MILLVAGTRPEVVKLAPVYLQMRKRRMDAQWLFTGQQQEIGRQTFEPFGIKPEHSFTMTRPMGDLMELNSLLTKMTEEMFRKLKPKMVVVQGDTLTAAVGGMQAFLNRTPLAHVEAGLRSWDVHSPFPEEASRVWIDAVADLKFAPTQAAAMTLSGGDVWVTGNTEIDALRLIKPETITTGRYAVVTAHRRENLEALDDICDAVTQLAKSEVFQQIIWAVHPNPEVKNRVIRKMFKVKNVSLVGPQPYDRMVNLMRGASMVLTDSGGLQEQALALGVPCLVLRKETERPEGVQAGGAMLVGTDVAKIVGRATWLMTCEEDWQKMAGAVNPYGDGKAAERIALVVKAFLSGKKLQSHLGNWSGVSA